MEFRILGPLDVVDDGRVVALGGAKQRALLAVLLLNANRVVSSDSLIDALWQVQPPERAQKALQVLVSQLRKTVGASRIVTRSPGYLLRVEQGELDLERFEGLAASGGREELREALALWRGAPLAEFAFEGFARHEIARLEGLRQAALEQRIDADLALGGHADLVGELEALVSEYPLRERLRAQLMLALYRSGRQAEALAVYQDARDVLVEELGIEPGKSLRELHQAILRQDTALDLVPIMGDSTPAPARSGIVGRDSELSELDAGLDDAFSGRGRLFLLVGEPGIGKSRLAEELAARAEARGARLLVGRCWEAGGAPAYWPWVQSLRTCIRESNPAELRAQLGAGAADLAQLLPELHDLLPDLTEPVTHDPDAARFRLFDAVSSFLRTTAQTRPIVLVIDDLHAADEPSLLLLQFLTRALGDTRLLIIGAYRDIDPGISDRLTAVLTELVREPVTRSLALAGFGEPDVARFVELASGVAASGRLAATIHEKTGGNPLFVGEIVRMLAAEGTLTEELESPRLVVPQSVRGVIARRLRSLSVECRDVIVLGSVLGREFGLEALKRMADLPEEQLLDILDQAMDARVVSEVADSHGRLRFAHVLIRDSLYEALTPARRVRLHRQAAAALESIYGEEPGVHLAELAYHAIAGRDFARARSYAQRAGDRAVQLLAYEEAARLYGIALDAHAAAGGGDDVVRCDLLLLLGEAQSRAGNSDGAKVTHLAAALLARRHGLALQLARAAADYGGRIVWARAGEDDRLVPLLEEGLAAVPNDDVELRVRLLCRLSGALRDEPSRERRNALSAEAVELARQAGDLRALIHALDGRFYAIIAPDSIEECSGIAAELCSVAAQTNDLERLVQGRMNMFIAHITVGNVSGAAGQLDLARRSAEELRQPLQLWQSQGALAMLALATGRLADAEALADEALELGRRAIPAHALAHHAFHQFILNDFKDHLETVEETIGSVVAAQPRRPLFRCALAYIHARTGNMPPAQEALDQLAAGNCSGVPFDMEWLLAMSLLGETASLLGDKAAAAVLYPLLLPYDTFNAVDTAEGMRGSVSRYLGQLAATLRRWDDAASHFENAVAQNAQMNALPWLALSRRDYARMMITRGRPGDATQAKDLLDQAAAAYSDLGLTKHAEAAVALRD